MLVYIVSSAAIGFVSSFIIFTKKPHICDFIKNTVSSINTIIVDTKYIIANFRDIEKRFIDVDINVERRLIDLEVANTELEQRLKVIEPSIEKVLKSKQPGKYAIQSQDYAKKPPGIYIND